MERLDKQTDSGYRHEYKYACNAIEQSILKSRMQALLKVDPHATDTGLYRIRSLYFDTPDNICYFDTENGTDLRDKFRIRIYNEDKSFIVLEKKSKKRQMTQKQSCIITEELCRSLMIGMGISIEDGMPKLQKKLLYQLMVGGYKPAVIVEYVRYPFIEKNGNVRVTFDEQINSSHDFSHFLDREVIKRPILEMGQSILEVKWDAFLPDYIKNQLQLDSLQWMSFSKYYLCRKYNTLGGMVL